jgi:hypothetical protein
MPDEIQTSDFDTNLAEIAKNRIKSYIDGLICSLEKEGIKISSTFSSPIKELVSFAELWDSNKISPEAYENAITLKKIDDNKNIPICALAMKQAQMLMAQALFPFLNENEHLLNTINSYLIPELKDSNLKGFVTEVLDNALITFADKWRPEEELDFSEPGFIYMMKIAIKKAREKNRDFIKEKKKKADSKAQDKQDNQICDEVEVEDEDEEELEYLEKDSNIDKNNPRVIAISNEERKYKEKQRIILVKTINTFFETKLREEENYRITIAFFLRFVWGLDKIKCHAIACSDDHADSDNPKHAKEQCFDRIYNKIFDELYLELSEAGIKF